MRISAILTAAVIVLATLVAGLAYYPYNSYGNSYGYRGSTAVMVGYNQGYTYNNGYFSAYQHADGYKLDYPGYIHPGMRAISEPTTRGMYSGYTGAYHDAYTGRMVSQYRDGYRQVPLRYNYDPYTVHYAW